MTDDPRKAKTLGEAALNPDGKTYNGARALSWLSAAVSGGKGGLSESEVLKIWNEVLSKKGLKKP